MTGEHLRQVGFVVIGRNEGSRLEACLRSILVLSSQIVYADSASSDGSVALARSLGVHVVCLDDGQPTTAARGRNTGFHELRRLYPHCTMVQFLDGDCILEPTWPVIAKSFMSENPRAAVACGLRYERAPQVSFFNALMDEEWRTPIGEAAACGGDSLVRIAAFEQAGGFNGNISAGEEPEFCSRLRAFGWTISRLDAAMTEHDANIHSLWQWWARAKRSGFGYAQVHEATRDRPDRLYGRELSRAFLWALIIPFLAILAFLAVGLVIALFATVAIYGLQVAKLAFRQNILSATSWKSAALMVLTKFAELQGAASYYMSRGKAKTFDYRTSLPDQSQ